MPEKSFILTFKRKSSFRLCLVMIFLASLLPGFVWGTETEKAPEPPETAALLARIRHQFRQEKVFNGRFTQKTTYADTDETVLSLGLIWIQGPDKMRWEYQLPEKQLLVSDGATLWYHSPDLNQVMVGTVKEIKEARIIINLLAEIKANPQGFKLTVNEIDELITVELRSLAENQAPPFQKLKMVFARDSLQLQETMMVDLFANRIDISYKWLSGPDPSLPPAFFTFVPPAGCDVMPLGQ
ncbi:MAG TPA: outer membrane lipoprotein carrier protein LolA [Proteobacteria bacterium]|nr:outer membrane lipoprotein carrier protein LolA [Pseudomonadota bacterium]